MSATPFLDRHDKTQTDPRATITRLGKLVAYATTMAGVYLSIGFLFYYAAKEKLIDDGGTMPAGLQHAFAGSFFARVPGNNASWVMLGILEAVVVVLLAVSLLHGEFLVNRTKPVLFAGLGTALLAFGVMGLANDMIGDSALAAELFTYFGLTAVVTLLVRSLPPYRSLEWIAGGQEQ